jgi:hypothetical protein
MAIGLNRQLNWQFFMLNFKNKQAIKWQMNLTFSISE